MLIGTPAVIFAGSELAAELNAPGTAPERDVEIVHTLLQQYLRRLRKRQGLPIGNDSDLARVLSGKNPMHVVWLASGHRALGPEGRLVDRWSRPYFIHPRGNAAYEIRSAGPDGKMFTADDLVSHPGSQAGETD